MPTASLSIAELYLAFRQAKAALFFEKRGVGLSALAEYEQELPANLKRLQKKLAGGSWFDKLEVGEVMVVPKRFHHRQDDADQIIRIGSSRQTQGDRPVDVQVRVSPHPDFAIAEVLYLRRFGALLESTLSEEVLGYRLDLRDRTIPKHRRWLFEYWPKRYQQFRSAPLEAANKILSDGGDALILSGDLANFYDTVAPDFLLRDAFIGELRGLGATASAIRQYKVATSSLLRAHRRFRSIAASRLSIPVTVGIPIGAITSRVIANVSLASLDRYVASRQDVTCYRRYVDDLVIVANSKSVQSVEEVVRHFLPLLPGSGETFQFDVDFLERQGSEFQVQQRKVRVHHLRGEPGTDFINAVAADFAKAISERRAFIDSSTLIGDGLAHLIRASNTQGSPLRVLREADRARLERFALSTSLRSLERVTSMINREEAKELVRGCLERVGRVLDSEDNWVDDLDVSLRLLKLAISTGDWDSAKELRDRMDRVWGTVDDLRATTGQLYYRGREINPNRESPWIWLRNYLHERRLEAICACLPIGMDAVEIASKFPGGIKVRTKEVKGTTLRRRAEQLALADLRARDREDDGALDRIAIDKRPAWLQKLLRSDRVLASHLKSIERFIDRCRELGDRPWLMPAARLYLATRPPSYFDIARRWLYRVEESGFDDAVFEDLIMVVNAVRGTQYSDPVGQVIDRSTIRIESNFAEASIEEVPRDPRIILGNLVVSDAAWQAAATRLSGSHLGRPLLTKQRLLGLADVLDKAERASRGKPSELLVLPELSLPRQWFRIVANHVVKTARFGLVTGLEYFHYNVGPYVANQVFAVLPGPFMSVATWPWTKRLPAREEGILLSTLNTPLSYRPPAANPLPRTVIHSDWGTFSVLICSELIETRRVADLLGRAQVVLCPAWNPDTASYDHLVQSVGFQLHAIIAIANNGHYSDCRVWAPRTERWERDLCRLIERDVNDIVYVDIPVASLSAFQAGDKQAKDRYQILRTALHKKRYADARRELERLTEDLPGLWRPLPPDWS